MSMSEAKGTAEGVALAGIGSIAFVPFTANKVLGAGSSLENCLETLNTQGIGSSIVSSA
jgi:hypothetical protein